MCLCELLHKVCIYHVPFGYVLEQKAFQFAFLCGNVVHGTLNVACLHDSLHDVGLCEVWVCLWAVGKTEQACNCHLCVCVCGVWCVCGVCGVCVCVCVWYVWCACTCMHACVCMCVCVCV